MFDPNKVEVLQTSIGAIKVRPPRGSDRLLAGQLAQDAPNLVTIFEALLCVVDIGGQPQPRPSTRLKLDALADRLGVQAMENILEWYNNTLYPEMREAREELGPGATVDEVVALVQSKRSAKTKNLPEIQ